LEDLLDQAEKEETPEEQEDPDIKADPINDVNLKETIAGFIRSLAQVTLILLPSIFM